MKQLTLPSFFKFSVLSLACLFAMNRAGLGLYLYFQKSGRIAESRSAGKVTWSLFEHSFVRQNDLGIRDLLTTKALSELDRQKIVFLGNSVVFGKEVLLEDTFPKLIAKKLNTKLAKDSYYAINAGCDGFDIYREFAAFRRVMARLKPKVVVWVPGRSDLIPKNQAIANAEESKHVNGASSTSTTEEVICANMENLGQARTPIDQFSLLSWDWWFTGSFRKLAQKIYYDQSLHQDNYFSSAHNKYYSGGLMKTLDEAGPDIERTIDDFVKELRANDIQLITIFIPPRMFSRTSAWKDALSFHEIDEMLMARGVPTFVLFPHFKERNTELFADYVHLNKDGHELVAQYVSDFLKNNIR